jgi:hypothetical protein
MYFHVLITIHYAPESREDVRMDRWYYSKYYG